jgi:spermidine synthase
MHKYKLEIIVFIAGAVIMALELTGTRIIAPYLGTSVFIWTSLIGIILGCLSFGYWWGGKLVDRNPSCELLSSLLLTASGLTAIVVLLHYPVLTMLSTSALDLRISGIAAAMLLFSGPSVILGMVAPFAARLQMTELNRAGSTVGRLYALSTIGSLAGTFAAGFGAVAFLGTTTTVLALALLLFVACVIAQPTYQLRLKCLLGMTLLGLFFLDRNIKSVLAESGLVDIDTPYQRAFVMTKKKTGEEPAYRLLVTDVLGSQSMMYLDAPEELAGEYPKYFETAFHFVPNLSTLLIIGGGAYTVPKYFASHYPNIQIDVVEIDPGVTRIARDYFFLKDYPNLKIIHEDARTFLNHTSSRYDAVFLDAFQSSPSVPFHLTTSEAFSRINACLKEHGVLIMNLISGIEGEHGKFLRAEVATLRGIFHGLQVFAVANPDDGAQVQNLIITAEKSAAKPISESGDAEEDYFYHHLWTRQIPADLPVLTDDYAPVESYMLPVYIKWRKQLSAK